MDAITLNLSPTIELTDEQFFQLCQNNQQVEIYRPSREVEVLKSPTSLSGEDVLPGFVLDLTGILN
jgi:Uma2 family endonuclease